MTLGIIGRAQKPSESTQPNVKYEKDNPVRRPKLISIAVAQDLRRTQMYDH